MTKLHVHHLSDETNQVFLTLLEHQHGKNLVIIENIIDDEVVAFVLDLLSAEGLDQSWFLSVATRWFYSGSDNYPLSFEFAKLGAQNQTQKIIRSFHTSAIKKMVGMPFVYEIKKPKIKKKKLIQPQTFVEIKF